MLALGKRLGAGCSLVYDEASQSQALSLADAVEGGALRLYRIAVVLRF